MTEPTFRNQQNSSITFPKEPSLSSKPQAKDETSAVGVHPFGMSSGSRISITQHNRDLLKSLSKDLEDLSKPYEPEKVQSENFDPKPIETRVDFEEQQLDTSEHSAGTGCYQFLLLVFMLILIVVAIWQICLFLQPKFMYQSPVREFSSASCQYFYCPPYREPRILSSELQATGPDQWEVRITLQNQDMRSQALPQMILSLYQDKVVTMKAVFDAKDYRVIPSVMDLDGGQTVKVVIPFQFDEGRPASFKLQVIPNNELPK